MEFRALRADEVDCRIAMVRANGISVLLYKDARCDQNILDETVGCMNWQRHHSRDNANCIVSIWDADKKMWIEKEDTGTESNTEAEKGLASDSFKRACFNWGIGRELYTAPFIWFTADACNIRDGKCYDKFECTELTVENHRVTSCKIINKNTKNEFTWHEKSAQKSEPKTMRISSDEVNAITELSNKLNVDQEKICSRYGYKTYAELDKGTYESLMKKFETELAKRKAAVNG